MGRQRKGQWRVLGPYPRSGRPGEFVGFLVEPNGSRTSESFAGETAEQDGREWAEALREKYGIGQVSRIATALAAYEEYRQKKKDNKSVAETSRRLNLFFPNHDLPVRSLDRKQCAAYYEAFSKRNKMVQRGKDWVEGTTPISVDYHRNTLAEAKTFLRWCIGEGWIKSNPLETVKGHGRRNQGKPQLHIDESRLWEQKALRLANDGDPGALAALITLYCGLRASEITHLRCRDLDDNGSLLWVGEDVGGRKTKKSRRQIGVPLKVRAAFLRLVGERDGEDWLWGAIHLRNWPRYHVRKICKMVGVKKVSAHGMRGLHGSMAMKAGMVGEVVANQYGHEHVSTTQAHYVTPEAFAAGTQIRALERLEMRNEILDFITHEGSAKDPQKKAK